MGTSNKSLDTNSLKVAEGGSQRVAANGRNRGSNGQIRRLEGRIRVRPEGLLLGHFDYTFGLGVVSQDGTPGLGTRPKQARDQEMLYGALPIRSGSDAGRR
jgi:hypothetical protein